MNDSNLPRPKRRWYQFSLRTLLILVTLFATACSWYAYEMNEAANRRAAIAEIERLGGEVDYCGVNKPNGLGEPPKWYSWLRHVHGDEYLGNAVAVSFWEPTAFRDHELTDGELLHLKSLANLEFLALGSSQITDGGLAHLKGLTNLEVLYLACPRVTDDGLVHLKDLTNLEVLSFGRTQITDAGLVHLKHLSKIEELGLGTRTTDAGLEHLKDLTKIRDLRLYDTQITDAGLVHLARLTRLERLDLGDTEVTDEGVEKLQEALPDCEIFRDRW